MTKEDLCSVRAEYPIGTAVALITMNYDGAPPVGTVGIVTGVDDDGTIFVDWENGSKVGVAYGEDVCIKVSELKKQIDKFVKTEDGICWMHRLEDGGLRFRKYTKKRIKQVARVTNNSKEFFCLLSLMTAREEVFRLNSAMYEVAKERFMFCKDYLSGLGSKTYEALKNMD